MMDGFFGPGGFGFGDFGSDGYSVLSPEEAEAKEYPDEELCEVYLYRSTDPATFDQMMDNKDFLVTACITDAHQSQEELTEYLEDYINEGERSVEEWMRGNDVTRMMLAFKCINWKRVPVELDDDDELFITVDGKRHYVNFCDDDYEETLCTDDIHYDRLARIGARASSSPADYGYDDYINSVDYPPFVYVMTETVVYKQQYEVEPVEEPVDDD